MNLPEKIPIRFVVDGGPIVGVFTRVTDHHWILTCSGYYQGELKMLEDCSWQYYPSEDWGWMSGFFGNYLIAWVESNCQGS